MWTRSCNGSTGRYNRCLVRRAGGTAISRPVDLLFPFREVPLRIAIAQLWQESNTFNPIPTTRADFEAFGVLRGNELVEKMAQTNELGGFIQSLRQWPEQPDIVGLVRLPAWPGGPLTPETLAWIRAEVRTALVEALPVDGVLLALHGALVAEGEPDVEGVVLEDLRALLPPEVPIVATLDLHANLTQRMVELADALVLYHTVPHVDVFQTGQRGAGLLRRILIDGAQPTTAFQPIPMVPPPQRANTQDPDSISYALRQLLDNWEQDPRILTAGLATVQPWLDIPHLGSAALVTTDNNATLAERRCHELAGIVWEQRERYLTEMVDVAEAVEQAHGECGQGLVVLSDGADATTSGAPGDSTAILAELVRHDWPRPALVPVVAPELVAEARKMGTGKTWTATFGGRRDTRFSRPITLEVEAERFLDARFVLSGHLATNLPIDMGPAAVLRHGNVRIVATTLSGPHFAPQFFECAGLDPFAASVLVAKSPCGFRAAYASRAHRILVVRSPGCAPPDFWNYEYQHSTRPLWPWDNNFDWEIRPQMLPPLV